MTNEQIFDDEFAFATGDWDYDELGWDFPAILLDDMQRDRRRAWDIKRREKDEGRSVGF